MHGSCNTLSDGEVEHVATGKVQTNGCRLRPRQGEALHCCRYGATLLALVSAMSTFFSHQLFFCSVVILNNTAE